METSDVGLAVDAAMSTASEHGLTVEEAVILDNSNKRALRLLPCDAFARVAFVGREVAAFEVELAERLCDTGSPAARLDPRMEPRVYLRNGFAVTYWTYYEPVPPREVAPAEYADVLERLHAGMRQISMTTPHFTDRVAGAQSLAASRELTPELPDADRAVLAETLSSVRRAIEDRAAPEQLLHGEPHEGNLLRTKDGLLFIDLETCCRGPVEFDIAHAPVEVSERYANVDRELVRLCRILVLAMVTMWRWDKDDQLPNGRQRGQEWFDEMRALLAEGS